jgi:tyrosyl-tRNA synthetase
MQIILLRRLQQAGHTPIALLGGGTGMIGDPGGKTDERILLTPEQLAANAAGVKAQLEQYLDFAPGGAIFEDNAAWLRETRLLEFLRDVGKHFSVNEMVRKDSVRLRLEAREQGISYTEFSYMLLQAWDFLQLYDRYGCRLQLGGSDQWGNIIEGVDLIRRRREVQAFGLTAPLITKADGTKFGKSESGTIWLDPDRTSPYQFFQFWIRTSDAEVGRYLRVFTFLDRPAIAALDEATAAEPARRQAQRVLARELTGMVHGEAEARRAERAAEVLFTEEVATLDEATLAAVLADAPTSPITVAELEAGLLLSDALVRTGLATSRSDTRRQIAAGGVYVDNRRQSEDRAIGHADVIGGRFVILRRGKTQQHVLRLAD